MTYFVTTLQPYLDYLHYFIVALLAAFILTPVIGYIAKKFGVFDTHGPGDYLFLSRLRKPSEESLKTRIKKQIIPRVGGFSVLIPFVLLTIATQDLSKQVIALLIGILILAIVGALDDKYQIGPRAQFAAQVIASLMVVAAGISIDSIQSPFDTSINLRTYIFPFSIGENMYSIALPADLITIAWILMMINAVNWIFGSDGLGEGISVISFLTILLISVKYQNPLTAFLAAIAAGGILGFLPFNLPPSKIYSGTCGTNIYGFLIAVLSILGGVKVSTSVVVLIIPLIDMLWVIVGRINRYGVENLSDVLKVTTTGDDTHLHHRLLKLGFSPLQVAQLEWLGVGICAIIAFGTADLPKVTIISIIAVIVLIIFFIVSLLLKSGYKVNGNGDKSEKGSDETPESRYAY